MPNTAAASALVAKNKGGRPRGGQNPTSMVRDELRKAVCRLRKDESVTPVRQAKVLRMIVNKLVELALEGDLAAIREVTDRLDGKATQQVQVDKNIQITHIEHTIVDMPQMIEAGELEVIEVLDVKETD